MELQLDLSLSTTHNPIDGSNLNNKGFDPHDQILGLKPWSHDGCLLDKKRSFEDAFGKFKDSPQALSLLLWSGHPNDEDDEKREKKRLSCRLSKMNEEVMEGDDLVVGWPPIKSWRKKVLRQQPSGGRIVNNRVAGGGGSDLINSKYVKVKMEGVAIARKIDLKLFHSYQTLTRSLITMFGKCQQLEKDNANYRLAYQDKDGDWLLAGDIPWQSFIESVHRLELLRNGGLLPLCMCVICCCSVMRILSFSFIVVWVFQVVTAQPTTDPNEVAALSKMIDYWNLRGKLNITTDPCAQNATWANENANPRVACDCPGNTCHITHLKIYALDIAGEIPNDLFVLKELMDLNLGQNVLNGSIPPGIGHLSKMQYLWASDNLFNGKLPDFFGTLTKLRVLRLQGTSLQGPIPSSFSALNNLEDLRIGDLSGEDSSLEFLKNQTNLSILVLRNCLLSGQIPEQLGTFSKLKLLDLSFNKLTGHIPTSFQDLASLQYMYLGNNNLSGGLPANIIGPQLNAIDVSFNPLSGNLPQNFAKVGSSMIIVGTSINANGLQDSKVSGMLQCLKADLKCSNKFPSSSFSIKCGGTGQTSASGIEYDDDSETLGAASQRASSDNLWAVSNVGNFISNPAPEFIAQTDSQITETLESELYKTARISPSSLRYYGLGLENGRYSVELHFAEIVMDDVSQSWKGLGRRLFDVYIQGKRVLQDFNIQKEAGGSKRAMIKTFEANVTNTIMDIHFFWAGKGTCCIPFQSTYGPLVSAIHVSQVSDGTESSKRDKKQVGKLVGIAVGCAAGLVIISSLFYLWWTKDSPKHILIQRESPGK